MKESWWPGLEGGQEVTRVRMELDRGDSDHLVTINTTTHLCRGSLSSTLLLYCALLKLSCPAPGLHPWPGPRCRDTVSVVIENRSGLSSWVA